MSSAFHEHESYLICAIPSSSPSFFFSVCSFSLFVFFFFFVYYFFFYFPILLSQTFLHNLRGTDGRHRH